VPSLYILYNYVGCHILSAVDLRVGVVGFGWIARLHAAAWVRLGVPLHVYAEPAEHAAAAVAEFGAVAHPTLADLLAAVDVVDVCTPTDTHAPVAVAAARAGRHVICEKPIASTLAEAAEVADACARAGVSLHVGQVVRYFPPYAAAHRVVAAGELGEPAVLRFRRASGLPARPWLRDEVRSGGVIADLMIHDLDQARWFAGEVVRVYARAARPVGATRTQAYAILTHAGGAISHVSASWALDSGFETSFEIAGTRGLVDHDSDATKPLRADRPGLLAGPGGLPPVLGDDPFTLELGEFLTAIRGGPPARVSAADAAAALAITVAAIESADTGRAVTPSPVPAAFHPFTPITATATATAVVRGSWE